MPHLTPAEAARRARIAVERYDGSEISAPARRGFLRTFEAQVEANDPELRQRDPAAFAQQVAAARSVYMSELAVRGVEQRQLQEHPPRYPLCAQGVRGIVRAAMVAPETSPRLCVKHRTSWQRSLRRETQADAQNDP